MTELEKIAYAKSFIKPLEEYLEKLARWHDAEARKD